MIDKIYRTVIIIGILCCVGKSYGQSPAVFPTAEPEKSVTIDRWEEASSYSIARRELEGELLHSISPRGKSDLMYQIIQISVEGKDYEEAYQWSTTFLTEFPYDRRKSKVLYFRGMCAYQTDRLDTALTQLNYYLINPGNNRRGEAFYWRGLVDIEKNEWELAEDDFQHAYNDTLADEFRDQALIGWSLALEHRGALSESMKLLQTMTGEFPDSKYHNDAQLRKASLSLQQDNPAHALELLQGLELQFHSQREELLLLRGESHLQIGDYTNAQGEFTRFLKVYPESPFVRKARFGLAWAYLKGGDAPSAKAEFDSLGSGSDTLSLNALYQSGALSLLGENVTESMKNFETLTDRSPYDIYSDKAYYEMGLIQYRSKKYREARKNFQLVTRLFPESDLRLKAYRMQGEASVAMSDFANAQYAFGQVRRLGAPAELLAPSMYHEGICLYHLGRFNSSWQRLRDFLKQFPKDHNSADAYVWEGEALYQDGKYEEAEQAYSSALDRLLDNTKRAQAAYGIAWSLFEQKQFSKAADAFDSFTSDYPKSDKVLDASLRKADCYFFLKQYDKATALYASLSEAKNSSQNAEYAAFQLAMSYIQRGESNRGIAQLRDFQARYPNSLYAEVVQFNIGWTYYTMEQYPEAIVELRVLTTKFPESQLMPRVLFNMGDAFYNLKQYDSARTFYEAVIQQYPKSPLVNDAMSGLKFTFQAQGKSAEALSTIDKYMSAKPTAEIQQNLLLNKADILFGQGDLDGAIDQYKQILTLNPDKGTSAKALQQMGHIYELKHDTASAVTYYKQIIADYPATENAPHAALALAIAYTGNKQFTDAIGLLQNFDRQYPGSLLIPEAQYRQGLAYYQIPDKEKAKSQFQLVIANGPTEVFAERSRMFLAQMFQDNKEYQAAIDTLNGVVNRRSDDIAAEALLMMGDNYLFSKRPVDALQAYKDVIDQYTDYPVLIERAHLGAGSAYERLKDRKHARLEYQEITKNGLDPQVKKEAEDRLKKLRR